MPFIGSVLAITGRRQDPSIFFKVVSFLSPGTTFHLDLRGALGSTSDGSGSDGSAASWNSSPTVFRKVNVGTGFDTEKFVVKQLFATSRDGTRVPMFVVHKKGIKGPSSCLLYGYGGFNISLTPGFSTFRLPFIEAGGVYVMSNLRGRRVRRRLALPRDCAQGKSKTFSTISLPAWRH